MGGMGEAETERVMIRLTRADYLSLIARADAADRGIAEYIRSELGFAARIPETRPLRMAVRAPGLTKKSESSR